MSSVDMGRDARSAAAAAPGGGVGDVPHLADYLGARL
jgi:hypothetical protein